MKKRYILLFTFILLMMILSPISGDDWGNYIEGAQGAKHMFTQAIGMYFSWEGRFISRLLINILTYNKWLWNIVNSICLTSIIYLIYKIINKKDLNIFYLSILSLLLVNIYTMTQTYTWLAGNITYLFPLCLIILYMYLINKNYDNKILLLLLNIIIPMFVEHNALILIIINMFNLIYKYIQDKHINKYNIIYLIISIISTTLMLMSPGTHLRSLTENTTFNSLNIMNKILYNIPNFIYYTFIINTFMLIILIISYIYLINKTIKNKYIKYITMFIINIYPIINIIVYNLSIINITNYNYLINQYNCLVIIYWIVYILIFIYLIIKNKYYNSLLFILLGLSANTFMLASPTWGYRTSLTTYVLFMISLLLIMKEIKFNKIASIIIKVITVITIIFYIICFINVYILNLKREQLIKDDISNNSEIIHVIKLPGYAPCNSNPLDEYHIKVFKKYYHISEDKDIIVIEK